MMHSVLVLMSTYNGEKYLKTQLDSILAQEGIEVQILVRDDGSTDGTLGILQKYAEQGKLTYYTGPNLKPARSFMDLVRNAPTSDYYAFADQDDVWDIDKLASALTFLQEKVSMYALYCGAAREVDISLNILVTKPPYYHINPGFLKGEIPQPMGCTMVWNHKLQQLLGRYIPQVNVMHDGWVHLVCLAVNGYIVYDSRVHMSYRQHENNQIGGTRNLLQSIRRRLNYYKWIGKQGNKKKFLEILSAFWKEMPIENVDRCKFLCSYDRSLKNKLQVLQCKNLWKGRLSYKIINFFLIIFNLY